MKRLTILCMKEPINALLPETFMFSLVSVFHPQSIEALQRFLFSFLIDLRKMYFHFCSGSPRKRENNFPGSCLLEAIAVVSNLGVERDRTLNSSEDLQAFLLTQLVGFGRHYQGKQTLIEAVTLKIDAVWPRVNAKHERHVHHFWGQQATAHTPPGFNI